MILDVIVTVAYDGTEGESPSRRAWPTGVKRHCPACEVGWHGAGLCWSCGGDGEVGAIPVLLAVAVGCGA